ncbi:MAG TPA: hypothetical protein VE195_05170 [Acidobacteriaceae bacterium]|nr:hypothetical protein [Acidobacteriaceae bacterium]
MKTLSMALAFLLLSTVAAGAQVAQVITVTPLTDSDINLIRQDIQGAKNDIIKDTMQFSDAEGKAFWPVYQEYSAQQRAIAAKRFAVIVDYSKSVGSMTDAEADSLTRRMLQSEDDVQTLRKDYLPKFQAALGAKRAAKFYQIDNRLTMILNVQLASAIPLIP